jgi:SRSO17 transposase
MPKIGRFPPFAKRFFRQVRKIIGCCHFAHFWRVVIALAAMNGRRNLRRIAAVGKDRRSRQAIAFFLTKSHWDAPEALRQTALDTLKNLGWRPGQTVYLAVDDTQKRKRGKRMDAVSRIFLHAEKVYAQGHTIVGCALIYRGVVIPCAVRLWASEEFCQKTRKPSHPCEPLRFRKLTELAAETIEQAPLPCQAKAIVVFDSYYLCPVVVRACEARHFRYVGVAKKNRNFFPDARPRDKRRLGTYGANVLRRDGRWMSPSGKRHRLAQRVGRLSKAGRVKLVFSRRPKEKSWIAMATNETRWGPKTVLSHYLNRWPIEVLFKMSKQYLGLGDYQMLRYRAVERYLHLVLIAHLLLTHLAADEPGAQADCQKEPHCLRLSSIPKMQQTLRAKLWDDVITSMEKGSRNRRAAKKIREVIQL